MSHNSHPCVASGNGSSQSMTEAGVQFTAEAASCPTQLPNLALEILDSSDDCIKVLDLDGRLLFMSRKGQSLLGIQDITSFLNTSWVNFWQGADQQAAINAIAKARAGEVCTFQGNRPMLNGEPKWWDSKVSPIRGADGQIERLLCISRDITARQRAEAERQQMEAALRASEEQFRLFAIASSDTVYKMSADWREMRLLEGKNFLASTQHSSQTWLEQYIPLKEQSRVMSAIESAIRTKSTFELEHRVIKLDGTVGWTFSRAIPLLDAQNEIVEWLGAASDITDRKQTELLLVEQKQLLEIIAAGTPLEDCLRAVCTSVFKLNSRVCACFLLTDTQGLTFSRSITPDLAPSFGQGLQDTPINDFCIGTCGEAVYRGQPITCIDIANDDRWSQEWRELCVAHGILSCYSTPVVGIEAVPYGSLMLCFDQARMPTNWEYQLAEFGTQIASIAFERDRATLALRQSEAFNRSIVESISDCIKVLDLNGYLLTLNKPGQCLLEIEDSSSLIGALWVEFWQGPLRENAAEAVHTAVAGGTGRFSGYCPTMKGTPKWWDIAVTPILDVTGKPKELLVVSRDITDRKQAEAAIATDLKDTQLLRDLSARLVSEDSIQVLYQEIISTAIALTRADAGTVQMLDQTTQELLLLATQGFDRTMTNHFYRVNASSHTSCGITLQNGNPTFVDFDVPESEDPDGSCRMHVEAGYLSAQSTPLMTRSGRVIGMVSTHWRTHRRPSDRELRFLALLARQAADLIEQRQFEQALRQSESRFRLMVESAKEYAIFTLDLNGVVTSWNAGAERLLGYSEVEIVGRNGRIVFTPEDNEQGQAAREMQLALTQGRAENERWHLRQDGSCFWGSGLMMPLQDEAGTTQGFVKIMQDKTAERQNAAEREQLLQQEQAARVEADRANHIKDEFLAVLSHELRSPLNPILGWTQLLRNGSLDAAKTAQAIETIERNAKLQVQLIEDLLDLSRVLRGKLSLNVMPVNLDQVILAALETVRLSAEAKSLHIQTTLAPLTRPVNGDAGRLQQVVWNLLSNAVKFTPKEGQITITLTQTANAAQIQVTDTGKGIHPDFLPDVFEHFRQEDSTTTRKFGGLGLGLAIARQIVELHGGTIGATSAGEGQGATFTVQLPLLNTSNTPAPIEPLATPRPLDLPLSQVRVLVVDDETDTRDLTAFVLEQAGAIVTAAPSAVAALEHLTHLEFDALVSDIGMPELDGYALMRQVRQRSQGIPAIALTAYAAEADQQQALHTGFRQHLAKPVDPEALVQAIATLCGREQAGRG
ncbi:PAS domain-containing protein [Nostoc sp.]|uniref:PAS domain-containing protein n=1 Tax=Nostoc sp. TaxID=1180 RepID=UPI002FF7BABE